MNMCGDIPVLGSMRLSQGLQCFTVFPSACWKDWFENSFWLFSWLWSYVIGVRAFVFAPLREIHPIRCANHPSTYSQHCSKSLFNWRLRTQMEEELLRLFSHVGQVRLRI